MANGGFPRGGWALGTGLAGRGRARLRGAWAEPGGSAGAPATFPARRWRLRQPRLDLGEGLFVANTNSIPHCATPTATARYKRNIVTGSRRAAQYAGRSAHVLEGGPGTRAGDHTSGHSAHIPAADNASTRRRQCEHPAATMRAPGGDSASTRRPTVRAASHVPCFAHRYAPLRRAGYLPGRIAIARTGGGAQSVAATNDPNSPTGKPLGHRDGKAPVAAGGVPLRPASPSRPWGRRAGCRGRRVRRAVRLGWPPARGRSRRPCTCPAAGRAVRTGRRGR